MAEAQGSGGKPTGSMSERSAAKDGGLRGSDILAGALTAAVAAVAGGYLGAAGSVASAFLVSVISGITLPLLRRPLRTGEEKMHDFAAKGGAKSGGGAKVGAQTQPNGVTKSTARVDAAPAESSPRGRLRVRIVVITTLITFFAAFAAIFVVQAISGNPLSSGTGQLQERVTGSGPAATSETATSPTAATQTPSTSSTAPTQTPSSAASSASPRPSASASPSSLSTATSSASANPGAAASGTGSPPGAPSAGPNSDAAGPRSTANPTAAAS